MPSSSGLKAILIDCVSPTLSSKECDSRLSEAESLINTYGGIVLVKSIQKKLIPAYKTYIGAGKIEELLEQGKKLEANILIINNELKPQQTYNLSEEFRKENIKVWDRIDLILKIFQKHASTHEAQLEIKLASIKHMGPRIFGMGIELSRQGGGIGTKGVGETNTEFMKRHLFKLEQRIKKDLEECKKVRAIHRASRKRKNLPTVGIIGYTNAGKSSLLNALTRKGAYTADKLFATLDTRVGKMYLPPDNPNHENTQVQHFHPSREVLISDTIGFIQNLPTTLINSFQSTLEETIEADLLLHVIDITDPRFKEKIKVVNDILAQINASDKPIIYIFNKIDQQILRNFESIRKNFFSHTPCFVSAYTGEGIPDLKQTIIQKLNLHH